MTGAIPEVNIGLPVYNGEQFLGQALDSLVEQTFGNIEIIICDNASMDGTAEIAREYAARDSRIRYVRNATNIGVTRNFNKVFELARAPFFKWATCDDACTPTLVERCLEALRDHPDAILAYCRTRLIDKEGNAIQDYEDNLHLPWPEPSRRFLGAISGLGRCNVLYGVLRSPLLRRARRLGSYLASDLVYIPELSLYGTFIEVPDRLFHRRIHAGAASSSAGFNELQAFYSPDAKKRPAFVEWRHLLEHLRSMLRAPVPLGERLQLFALLGRYASWNRGRLWRDLRGALRRAPGRS